MRLIDADALMPNAEYKGANDVVSAYDIANAPTIDPVKHGRWRKMNGERGYECSECGWESDTTWDFCPNCGSLNIEAWKNTDEEG